MDKEVIDLLEKAGNEQEYKTSWNEKGIPSVKKISEIKKGKKSRASGLNFELKVRKYLEEKGWIVAKWPNNIDLEKKEIIPAKRKFNPFSRVMSLGTGFPDFICFQSNGTGAYTIWGVEVKVNGLLDKVEKEKCRFLLEKNIFSEIVIAKKKKEGNRVEVETIFFREKYMKEKDV